MIQIVVLYVSLLLSENAFACSCVPQNLETSFSTYAAVFRGKVTKIEKGAQRSIIHFAVDTTWKGDKAKTQKLSTANSQATCGVQFEKNKEYVVFGWKGPKSKELEATACSQTALADNATETLAWLDQHHAPDDDQ